ncbi:tRNA-binding protein [Methanobacterium aggregans]|uniref:tRNA-binding protein n=1 Tax=Methanobacterium aggregans TaxID=1615586 RepID=UPI003210193D
MWDTSKDYRLRVAEKAVDLFIRTAGGANLKGIWNKRKSMNTAREMIPEIQTLYYSYMEPEDMAKSSQIKDLKEKVSEITQALGGEGWQTEFLKLVHKEEKEKLGEAISKIKFCLNTISSIDKRLLLGAVDDPIVGIDIRKGEVVSIGKHPNADNLLVCNVNIGDRAATVVTNDMAVKEGNNVGVSLLPPTNFMGVTSEGMFLGMGGSVLKDVEGEIGQLPHGFPLDALNTTRSLVEEFLK